MAISSTVGSYTDYAYTGGMQSMKAPINGIYRLECWGAGGGQSSASESDENRVGGAGGYSVGYIRLNAGDQIYVCVGQRGASRSDGGNRYNGGRDASTDNNPAISYGCYAAADVRTWQRLPESFPALPVKKAPFSSLRAEADPAGAGGAIAACTGALAEMAAARAAAPVSDKGLRQALGAHRAAAQDSVMEAQHRQTKRRAAAQAGMAGWRMHQEGAAAQDTSAASRPLATTARHTALPRRMGTEAGC